MKKNYLKLNVWMLFAVAGMLSLSACSSDDDNKDNGGGGTEGDEVVVEDGTTLNGNIAKGKTYILKSGRKFQLSGEYIVEDGAQLKIEPGVTITSVKDDTPDYILVKQGGKIDAQGTADSPIVMTAPEGDTWGGIHICGYAHTNKGGQTLSEIGQAPYGGDKDDDNSGTLKYIKLIRTGFALDSEHEANGISLYGVGSGTTIENVYIKGGKDDGIEFFGGSVNVKYAMCEGCEDDSFDWTEGWNGKAQFLVANQKGTSGAKDNGDCLMECDNNGDNFAATPIAHPVLANLTLIGNKSTIGNRGIRLRAGTQVEIYNAIVVGKPNSITFETKETENAAKEGTSKLMYITCDGGFKSGSDGKKNNYTPIYTPALFTAEANHNTLNSTNLSAFTMDNYIGTIDGGFDVTALGSFFTKASYQGAVAKDNNWTAWMVK